MNSHDGQEVRNGIRDGRCAEEAHGETPNFQVQSGAEESPQREGLKLDISTILLHTIDDELDLSGIEEFPGRVLSVGEINEEPIADNADQDRQLDHVRSSVVAKRFWVTRTMPSMMKIQRHPA